MQVVALKDLKERDELTVFYPAFEWDMSSPFECWCGAPVRQFIIIISCL